MTCRSILQLGILVGQAFVKTRLEFALARDTVKVQDLSEGT